MALLGLLIAHALFAVLPAVLLGVAYNAAVGVSFFAGSATLLSIFHALNDIKQEMRRGRPKA